jgi:hypothetical protein
MYKKFFDQKLNESMISKQQFYTDASFLKSHFNVVDILFDLIIDVSDGIELIAYQDTILGIFELNVTAQL